MRFMLTGHRGGGPVEVIAKDFASAVVAFRDVHRARVTGVSWWCEDKGHGHAPDGQWHAADELLEEVHQYDGARGPVTVTVNQPGSGHAVQADWVVWYGSDLAGYIVDQREDASARPPEDEADRPYEAWHALPGPKAYIGERHTLQEAALVVANDVARVMR